MDNLAKGEGSGSKAGTEQSMLCAIVDHMMSDQGAPLEILASYANTQGVIFPGRGIRSEWIEPKRAMIAEGAQSKLEEELFQIDQLLLADGIAFQMMRVASTKERISQTILDKLNQGSYGAEDFEKYARRISGFKKVPLSGKAAAFYASVKSNIRVYEHKKRDASAILAETPESFERLKSIQPSTETVYYDRAIEYMSRLISKSLPEEKVFHLEAALTKLYDLVREDSSKRAILNECFDDFELFRAKNF